MCLCIVYGDGQFYVIYVQVVLIDCCRAKPTNYLWFVMTDFVVVRFPPSFPTFAYTQLHIVHRFFQLRYAISFLGPTKIQYPLKNHN